MHLIGITVGELHVQRAEYEEYVGPLDDPDPAARYPLDELVDYHCFEDEATGTFRIAMKGPIRFSALISYRLGALRLQQTEIDEYVET